MHHQRRQLGSASSSTWLSRGGREGSATRNARGSDGVEQWLGSTFAFGRSSLRIGYDFDRGGAYRATNSAGPLARFCIPVVAQLSRIGLDRVEGKCERSVRH